MPVTDPKLTSHVFRPVVATGVHARNGKNGGPVIDPGMCYWLGTCNRPESEHISRAAFRERRRT